MMLNFRLLKKSPNENKNSRIEIINRSVHYVHACTFV